MDTVVRVTLVYFFLMAAMRVIGKREFGELGPFDIVVLLLIPEMITNALTQSDDSLTNAFVGVATLVGLVFLTSVLTYRFRWAERAIEGSPTVLVQHGYLVPRQLERERISPDELLAAMHQAGIETMDQVKWAILSTDGKISIVPWHPGERNPHPGERIPGM
ncbi:MAG TPA: YetF domain-containing protein [Longimicrobiales bacterium]|nr:YetF domain-containing protein [Longimicrobiales bacterium]